LEGQRRHPLLINKEVNLMKRGILIPLSIILSLLLLYLGRSTESAHTENIVEVGQIDVLLILPEAEMGNRNLIAKIGATRTTSESQLAIRLVQERSANAIVIHRDALVDLDIRWLQSEFKQGVIIGAVNLTRTELKELLEVPTSQVEVLPAHIVPPYMSYLFQRGEQNQSDLYEYGSGLAFLKERNEFADFVCRIEETSATNRYHYEQVEEQR
jgi:hypothetical protein